MSLPKKAPSEVIKENFRVKMFILEGLVRKVLQEKLTDMKELWLKACNTQDPKAFYTKLLKDTKWKDYQVKVIQQEDIKKLDTSLCIDIFISFPWNSNTAREKLALGYTERDAIIKIKNELRNYLFHNGNDDDIGLTIFESCLNVADVGLKQILPLHVTDQNTINAIHDKIAKIGFQARYSEVTSKYQLLQASETSWGFKTKEVLAIGSYGVVIKANNYTDGCGYAVKLVFSSDSSQNTTEDDYEASNLGLLAKNQHINIVNFKIAAPFQLTTEKMKNIILEPNKLGPALQNLLHFAQTDLIHIRGTYLVFDCYGETLEQWITKCQFRKSKKISEILFDILNGLAFIHKSGIVHTNINPTNILFHGSGYSMPMKIGGFGLSLRVEDLEIVETTGPRRREDFPYTAPEIFEKGSCSKLADVYSFGCIMYEICCNYMCVLTDRFVPWNDDVALKKDLETYIYQNPKLSKLLMGICVYDVEKRESLPQPEILKDIAKSF